jgi:thiol-disulfide isomerase/thioredoxin
MSSRHEKERRRQARLEAEHRQARRAARRQELTWIGAIVAAMIAIAIVAVVVVSGRKHTSLASTPVPATPALPTRAVPRQIRANDAQASQVVDASIQDKLASLRGVPVVVNQWASWCPNCKAEFGFFQQLSHRYARRVAFVGLDSQDRRGDAQAFLRKFPVPYPSLYDPGADQARSIGGGQGWPTTFYYDRTGRETYVREGGYTTLASLRADIQRYALGEG